MRDGVFTQHNPWWIVMPDITTYLQRVSWLWWQGTPATDASRGVPADADDAFAGFSAGAGFAVNQAMEGLDRSGAGAGDSGCAGTT